jgi:asparagine synthetase B (glutamine-hydrolysing)
MILQRLKGHYTTRSQPVHQQDYQIKPERWRVVAGFSIPVGGPFTQVSCDRGTAILYTSRLGEVPLYYHIDTRQKRLCWSEQRFDLPRGAKRLDAGSCLIWSPEHSQRWDLDWLPMPAIAPATPQQEAIAQYQQLILSAVQRRLGGRTRVAVSQSGGIDSMLITWALQQLGVEVVPIVACSSFEDLDIVSARAFTEALQLNCIPVVVKPQQVEALLNKALIQLEDTETSNIRMAIANILIARKCRELDIDLIFNGHGHDDIHGKGTLVKGVLAEQHGTLSERWRNARRLGTEATSGMLKMFASTFRHYGIEVRMPYYDQDLLSWAFAQPVEVIPPDFKKIFARTVARATLPPGFWTDEKHSIGYLTGAGLSLKQDLLKCKKQLFTTTALGQRLKQQRGN